MPRALSRAQFWLSLAVAVTIVMAFIPARWLGLVNDLAAVVNVPLVPFRHLGKQMQSWLRPMAASGAGASDELSARELWEERAEFERLYHESQIRIQQLEELIEQLQQVPLDNLNVPIKPLAASITGGNPRQRAGVADLNRGRRHGVRPGTVAVYAGVHLVGRVGEVGELTSKLVPMTSTAIEPIQARVLPQDQPERPITDTPLVLLRPTGDGTFEAELENLHPVHPGDVVRLDDRAWPRTAQAMIVGHIASVTPKDENRLLNRLVVRPRFRVSELAHVALKIEIDDGSSREIRP